MVYTLINARENDLPKILSEKVKNKIKEIFETSAHQKLATHKLLRQYLRPVLCEPKEMIKKTRYG
jgi:hypothetical protein